MPRARMVNFNDSGAIAAPHGDLLLHIAARAQDTMPDEAALARWLFDQVHLPALDQGPWDRAGFGFVTRPGFLAPALWPAASRVAPQSPGQLGTPVLQAFSNGDTIARDAWQGHTVLAVRGGGGTVRVLGHQHADLNSFILAHRRQRLLLDPGHSCYRGLTAANDRSTACHNTCTFERVDRPTPPTLTCQQIPPRPRLIDGRPEPPVARGGRRLCAHRLDEITVISSQCADVYGPPLRRFARFWILAGPHALFVIDHIVADEPIVVRWHWLLNNRDEQLRLRLVPPDRLVARRGEAGMKLFHAGENLDADSFNAMRHAYVHDAYHPKPNQVGEGGPDSGRLITFRQRDAVRSSLTVHAVAVDGYGRVAGWHLRREGRQVGLASPGAATTWLIEAEPSVITLRERSSGRTYRLADAGDETWSLVRLQ